MSVPVARAHELVVIKGYFKSAESGLYDNPDQVLLELWDERNNRRRYAYPDDVEQLEDGIFQRVERFTDGYWHGKWIVSGPSEPEYVTFQFVIAPESG